MDSYEVITTPEAFLGLREPWGELCARVRTPFVGQTFDWAWLCWQTVACPRGRTLACVVARCEGRLVLVWPLAISHDPWRGATARSLDSETSEYSDMLVEAGPDAAGRVACALSALRRARACDLVELANVRADTVLASVLATSLPGPRPFREGSMTAASVDWRGVESWESYIEGLDAKERRELGRKKRRLEEQAPLRMDVLQDVSEAASVIDWTLDQKLAWLESTGRHNAWIATPEHRAFLKASMATLGPAGRRVIFVLRLGETIIAMLLSSVADTRLEWFMCASDPAYARQSPAQVLREFVLRWAYERRLDCDFRMGEQRFKHLWGNAITPTSTWVIGHSVRGRTLMACQRAKRALVARLPARARAALKAIIRPEAPTA
jgi:CelD/BcsL family acetyltransferase involved in cellulose biosynthesis